MSALFLTSTTGRFACPLGLSFALLASATMAQNATVPAQIALHGIAADAGPTEPAPAGTDGAIALDALGLGKTEETGSETIPLFGQQADPSGSEKARSIVEPVPHVAPVWPLDISRVAQGRAQFRGERETLDFALVVPPGAKPDALTVVAVSSAFVDPSRSRLRVFVGDELVGEVPLASITKPEEVRLPVRSGLLRPGQNRIRIESELAHRLFCGATASYDLWTNIDLARSGALHSPVVPRAGEAGFLAAASAARSAGRPLLVRGDLGEPGASQLTGLATQLGWALGGGLTFASAAEAGVTGAETGPLIEVRHAGTPGITYRTEADGRQVMELRTGPGAFPALFAASHDFGRTQPPVILAPGTPTPLAELGFTTAEVAASRWTGQVQFRLPDDWLLNVRSRATLRLAYAHLSNLPAGAVLRVRVNGEAVRILPLEGPRRLAATPLEIRFDVGLLRNGRNMLDFEVEVPGEPDDQPCAPHAITRVEIGAQSTLHIPVSARMHLPGIARWISPGSGPLGIAAGPSGGDDVPLAMRIASALRTIPADAPEHAERRQLVVLSTADLTGAISPASGLNPRLLLETLQPPRPALRLGAAEAATGETKEALGLFSTLLYEARLMTSAARREFGALVTPDPGNELAGWLAERRGQAILFQGDPTTPEKLHLVLADDANHDEVAGALEMAAGQGTPLAGHFALLDRENAWHLWTDRSRLPVLEEPVHEGNWRGVIGNYASARPALFSGAVLAIALLSVVLANSYLAASRRQR